MACDIVNYNARQRSRALDELAKKFRNGKTRIDNADVITGETTFTTESVDGYTLTGTLDAQGNVRDVRIDGWSLAERAGYCDGCALEALRETDVWSRILRDVQTGSAGVSTYSRDALTVGGGRERR